MKSFISLIMAGLIGGLVCYGAITWSGSSLHKNVDAKSVSYSNSPVSTGPDFAEAAEMAQKAVVLIEAAESKAAAQQRYRNQDPMSQWMQRFGLGGNNMWGYGVRKGAGSGVIISKNGYILTNNHVVDFADEVSVKLNQGKEYKATIIGRDPSSDLAVIKIDANNLPTLEYADSDKARVGDWVLAVGNPFEYLTDEISILSRAQRLSNSLSRPMRPSIPVIAEVHW